MNNTATLSKIHRASFLEIVQMDYDFIKKTSSEQKLKSDIQNVETYDDLHDFVNTYGCSISNLGNIQLDFIIKDAYWNTTIYAMIAASKFKQRLNKNK